MENNKKNKLYYIITIVMILFTFFFGFLSGSCAKKDSIKNNYQPTLLNVQESLKPEKKEAFTNNQNLYSLGRQLILVPLYNIIDIENNIDLTIYFYSQVSINLSVNYNVDNAFNNFQYSVVGFNMQNRFRLFDNIEGTSSWFDLLSGQFGAYNPNVDFETSFSLNSGLLTNNTIEFNILRYQNSTFSLPDLVLRDFNFTTPFSNNIYYLSRDNNYFRSSLDTLHNWVYNGFYDSNIVENSIYFSSQFYFNVLQFRNLYFTAYSNGFEEGLTIIGEGEYNAGYQDGYNKGESLGYELGFKDGYENRRETVEDTEDRVNTIWNIFERAIQSVLNVLQFDLLPGIPLYVVIVVPVLFALLIWFIKLSQS